MRAYTLPATVALAMLVTGTLDASSGALSERDTLLKLPTSSRETGGRTGVDRTTRKAGNAGGFHPATARTSHTIEGIGLKGWHARAVRNRRQINRMRHAYLQRPTVVEAVNLACATYGHCHELWSKARCESHLNHRARNLSSGAAGIFQFLRSTWASTPYGRFDIFSPYANALAAGWMHRVGRGSEWSCR